MKHLASFPTPARIPSPGTYFRVQFLLAMVIMRDVKVERITGKLVDFCTRILTTRLVFSKEKVLAGKMSLAW